MRKKVRKATIAEARSRCSDAAVCAGTVAPEIASASNAAAINCVRAGKLVVPKVWWTQLPKHCEDEGIAASAAAASGSAVTGLRGRTTVRLT